MAIFHQKSSDKPSVCCLLSTKWQTDEVSGWTVKIVGTFRPYRASYITQELVKCTTELKGK